MPNYASVLRLLLWICIPIVLWILPKTFFNQGPTLCLYTLMTGTNCLGCGMTRSIMHWIHLDIATALKFNKLSCIVFPLLVVIYLRILYSLFHKIRSC